MRGIVLAATHETKLTSSGKSVPLPLVDIIDEPYLTTLCRRLAVLPDMAEIIVVTNNAILGEIQEWAESLPDVGTAVRVLSDETERPEQRIGAVGDIMLALQSIGLDDDIIIVGGDNWFTYDLEAFVRESQVRSPAIAVTSVTPGPRPSRFGWLEMDGEGRIERFLEHPESSLTARDLKASCVYYVAKGDLHWLVEFGKSESTNCSPGTLFAWLAERTNLFGVQMAGKWQGEQSSRGPDALAFRDIVRKVVNPRFSTWERQAAKDLEWATSHADLVDALDDRDPNKRIVAARLLGHARAQDEKGQELLSTDALAAVISALLRHLDDDAGNVTDGTWQSDDDEPPVLVSDTVAKALVNLGYADSPSAVFERAKRGDFNVGKSSNQR